MKKLTLLLLLLPLISYCQNSIYGKESKGKFESYQAKDGTIVKIGDTLTLGLPSNPNGFAYISQGGQYAANFLAGKKVVIDKLKTYGKAKTGYKMYIHFKGYGMLPVLIDYEIALETNELKHPNKD